MDAGRIRRLVSHLPPLKPQRLDLGGGMTVEARRDLNGHYFIGYARNRSAITRCQKALRKLLKLPVGTSSRLLLDDWLASLEPSTEAR